MDGAEERGVNGVASMSSIGRHGINGGESCKENSSEIDVSYMVHHPYSVHLRGREEYKTTRTTDMPWRTELGVLRRGGLSHGVHGLRVP